MPRRRLITERDIRRAAKDGPRVIDGVGAVITPAAADVARQLGVQVVRAEAAAIEWQTGEPAAKPAPSRVRRISLGADHGGVALKSAIATRLRELGHSVDDRGTHGSEAVDYPDFAIAVARDVASRVADFGIMVDGAGIGSCMAANKVRGVRAAMCHDITTATNAREHNDANVLTLGGGLLGSRLALAVVETFLATPFAGGRHAARVAKIDRLDERPDA
jgi:ribose 5-phosphate isomerase B